MAGKTKPDREHPTDGRADLKLDRLPPHDPESEQGIIGCILENPESSMAECLDRLYAGKETFYDLRNQEIYKVFTSMNETLEPIDMVTLPGKLRTCGLLEQIGGIAYLESCRDVIPSVNAIGHYLDIVIEKFTQRKMIQVCMNAVGRLYDCKTGISTEIDRVEREVMAVRQIQSKSATPTVKELVRETVTDIERLFEKKGEVSGLKTGLCDLDKSTDGLHRGELIVIAAFPSLGKTSLAMNIVENILLTQGKSALVFSLEMTALSLVMRFICSHARVNLRNVRDGFLSERDFPRLTLAAGKISKAAVFFQDDSDVSIQQLRARARRQFQTAPADVIVVDYIQLMTGSRPENRQLEVAEISRGLKVMAKELNVPVIALSQLNDDGKLRDSRAIGQDADGVWMLEQSKDSNEERDYEPINLWIRKQRNGPRNVCIPLTFLKSYTRFESAAKVSTEDYQ